MLTFRLTVRCRNAASHNSVMFNKRYRSFLVFIKMNFEQLISKVFRNQLVSLLDKFYELLYIPETKESMV